MRRRGRRIRKPQKDANGGPRKSAGRAPPENSPKEGPKRCLDDEMRLTAAS